MIKDLNKLKSDYPGIIKTTTIGKSVEGVPLHMIELGKGKRKILAVGTLHAREWINTPLLMEMTKTYARDYYLTRTIEGETIRHILNTHTFYIVPLANPDGVKLQQFGADAFPCKRQSLINMNNGSTNFTRWKSNIRGVDLNRNWNVQWDTPKSGPVHNSPGSQFYKGRKPESEREVKAIADWIRANNPIMIFDFHSSGEDLFWYYYQTGKRLERDRKIVNAMGKYSGYKVEPVNRNKPANTTFTRWGVMVRKVPSVCVENGVHTSAYQDMRNFNYIISKVRYLIPVAVVNLEGYPKYVAVNSVSLNKNELILETGKTYRLRAEVKPDNAQNKGVTWSSDNPLVASVDKKGNVTALSVGETTIRVKTDDGNKRATCKVVVPFIHVESITMLSNETVLYLQGVKSKASVRYEITPGNATNKNVTLTSENLGVVEIERGVMTAKQEGEETITVVTEDGNKSDSGTVIVIDDEIIYGDVNGDAIIDITDAIAILRHITGIGFIGEEYQENADITKCGSIVVRDAIQILRFIVGLH